MAKPKTSSSLQQYANQHNIRFKNTQANLVDITTRFNESVAKLSPAAKRNFYSSLKVAIANFRRNNPGVTTLNSAPLVLDRKSFSICQAIDQPLTLMCIDTTMQREPDLKWILHIITHFRPYQAQPIQVYQTTDNRWGGWDGQHTILALYLIAVHGLGMPVEEVVVPCNIYDIQSRGQLRGVFISNNTHTGKQRGKKSLDLIDIVEQMIYGVQVDGISDPEWVCWYQKWKSLADRGMFFAAEKFNNTDQTGAISRLQELAKASEKVVKQFAVYCEYVIAQQATANRSRAIDAKELPLIIEFLNRCEAESINLSDQQIRDLAQHLIDLFDADFTDKGPFWEQQHRAEVNSWTNFNRSQNIPEHLWGKQPTNSKTTSPGYNFLWSQLSHTWAPKAGIKMPKRPGFAYTPSVKDLF